MGAVVVPEWLFEREFGEPRHNGPQLGYSPKDQTHIIHPGSWGGTPFTASAVEAHFSRLWWFLRQSRVEKVSVQRSPESLVGPGPRTLGVVAYPLHHVTVWRQHRRAVNEGFQKSVWNPVLKDVWTP